MLEKLREAVRYLAKSRPLMLPAEFDANDYRALSPDFAAFSDDQLSEHYFKVGRASGLPGNRVFSRLEFTGLVPSDWRVLEVGPFATPMHRGPRVSYCDVLDDLRLRERAKSLGLDPALVPHVEYVLDEKGLDGMEDMFDAVASAHNIEHQPDFVHHLRQVQRRLLFPHGRLFLVIPDKRYCFDHFIAESTIAEILEAHECRRKVHRLRSLIEHRALTTHNDSGRHWREANAPRPAIDAGKVRKALDEWRAAAGAYIDVHAWYFSPDSFAEIIGLLRGLELIDLEVERVYPTRVGDIEFFAVLKLGALPAEDAE